MLIALQVVPVQDMLPAVPCWRCCPQVQAIPASMTSNECNPEQITGLPVQDLLSTFKPSAVTGQAVQSCIRTASQSVNSSYASMGTSGVLTMPISQGCSSVLPVHQQMEVQGQQRAWGV